METTIWEKIYNIAINDYKNGVTAPELVELTGHNRSTISSYLTLLTQSGYLSKASQKRTIKNRQCIVYVAA